MQHECSCVIVTLFQTRRKQDKIRARVHQVERSGDCVGRDLFKDEIMVHRGAALNARAPADSRALCGSNANTTNLCGHPLQRFTLGPIQKERAVAESLRFAFTPAGLWSRWAVLRLQSIPRFSVSIHIDTCSTQSRRPPGARLEKERSWLTA